MVQPRLAGNQHIIESVAAHLEARGAAWAIEGDFGAVRKASREFDGGVIVARIRDDTRNSKFLVNRAADRSVHVGQNDHQFFVVDAVRAATCCARADIGDAVSTAENPRTAVIGVRGRVLPVHRSSGRVENIVVVRLRWSVIVTGDKGILEADVVFGNAAALHFRDAALQSLYESQHIDGDKLGLPCRHCCCGVAAHAARNDEGQRPEQHNAKHDEQENVSVFGRA